jgi:hypothetical protein
VWGEGASDLWGRLEREEDERELELLDAVRSRLDRTDLRKGEESDEISRETSLEAA